MKVIRLRPGEQAPQDANKVKINSLPNGRFGFLGVSVTMQGSVTNTMIDTAITRNEFNSYEETEAAAIAWAKEHGIAELLIETDA